jgi:GcrA cell cycle regulator
MWTDDAIAMLRQMWLDGFSATQISGALKAARLKAGVTRNAVIGKIHRLGLTGRTTQWPPLAKQTTVCQPRRGRPGPLPAPAPKPQPTPDALQPLNTPLIDLRFGQCRAIVAGTGADALFCGHDVAKGSSWCAHHRSRYIEPPQPKKRKGAALAAGRGQGA